MEKEIIKYNVLDFTEYPGPRYKSQGKDSGEQFYEEVLKPFFNDFKQKPLKQKLEVNLDNTAGYASSFLDEAFGNLTYDFGQDFVKNHLDIKSNEEPDWIQIIFNETIPEWESKRQKGIPRRPDLAKK